jgi:hypothetical protein
MRAFLAKMASFLAKKRAKSGVCGYHFVNSLKMYVIEYNNFISNKGFKNGRMVVIFLILLDYLGEETGNKNGKRD